jgi:site-specific recombinase XerC
MTSDKYKLTETARGADRRQLQRCAKDVATNYISKQRRISSTISQGSQREDWRSNVAEIVAERFGLASLNCEEHLLDAVFRFLLSRGQSEATLRTYSGCLSRWFDWSDLRSLCRQVGTVPDEVSDFLHDLHSRGLAARSIVLHRDVLGGWFTWLRDRRLMEGHPITRDIRRAWRFDRKAVLKGDGGRQAFTQAEAQAVVAYLWGRPTFEAFAVLLMISAALRSDEVAALPFPSLVDRDSIVTVNVDGKGRRKRRVTLEPVTVAAWRRYERERLSHGPRGGLVYSPAEGHHYSERMIQLWCKAAARHVGRAEISSHDFRKTAATLRLENGWDLRLVADELGHSDPRLTLDCYVTRKPAQAVGTGLAAPLPIASPEASPQPSAAP